MSVSSKTAPKHFCALTCGREERTSSVGTRRQRCNKKKAHGTGGVRWLNECQQRSAGKTAQAMRRAVWSGANLLRLLKDALERELDKRPLFPTERIRQRLRRVDRRQAVVSE